VFNPFGEIVEDHSSDAALVEQAKNGDRSSLESDTKRGFITSQSGWFSTRTMLKS
jgi:hypothetical protein